MGGIGTVLVVTAQGGEGELADAICPKQAPVAIGGGGSVEDKGGVLSISAPIAAGELAGDGTTPNGWRAMSEARSPHGICDLHRGWRHGSALRPREGSG